MEIAVPASPAASAEIGGPSWSLPVAFLLARQSGPGITQLWDPEQNCPGWHGKPFAETCCASNMGGTNFFEKVGLRTATSLSGWSKDSLPFRCFPQLQRP